MENKTSSVSSFMRLSPLEIKEKKFKSSMLGIDKEEVSAFLKIIAAQIEKMTRSEKELQDKVGVLQDEVNKWRVKEQEIVRAREKAAIDAEDIRLQAQRDAEGMLTEIVEKARTVRSKTETWLEEVISQIEETERQRLSFITAFQSALESHAELLQQQQIPEASLSVRLTELLQSGNSLNS